MELADRRQPPGDRRCGKAAIIEIDEIGADVAGLRPLEGADEAAVVLEVAPVGGERVRRRAALGAHHFEEGFDVVGARRGGARALHCATVPVSVSSAAVAGGGGAGIGASGVGSSRLGGMRIVISRGLGSTKVPRANIAAPKRAARTTSVMTNRIIVGMAVPMAGAAWKAEIEAPHAVASQGSLFVQPWAGFKREEDRLP